MLRRAVFGSGVLLATIGVTILLNLNCAPWLRASGAVVWCGLSLRELRSLSLAWRRFGVLRIEPGPAVAVFTRGGESQRAALLPGSILLRRVGWLRLETASGVRYAELIAGRARDSRDWRRLQVIWKHVGVTR